MTVGACLQMKLSYLINDLLKAVCPFILLIFYFCSHLTVKKNVLISVIGGWVYPRNFFFWENFEER